MKKLSAIVRSGQLSYSSCDWRWRAVSVLAARSTVYVLYLPVRLLSNYTSTENGVDLPARKLFYGVPARVGIESVQPDSHSHKGTPPGAHGITA